jgi:hypothetical protein
MRVLLSIFLLFVLSAPARAWQLHVGRASVSGIEVQALALDLSGGKLHLTARNISAPALEFTQNQIDWQCLLTDTPDQGTGCAGKIRAGTPRWQGSLSVAQSAQAGRVELRVGASRIDWQSPAVAADGVSGQLRLQEIPLAWLQQRMVQAWPELASISGSADAQVTVSQNAERLRGTLALKDVGFDSQLGDIAGAGLAMQGALDIALGASTQVRLQLAKPRGQLLLGPVYFELPAGDSALEIVAAQNDKGSWQLPMLAWRDGEGLDFKAAAHFTDSDALDVRIIELIAELAPLSRRYLGSALATAGFEGLQLAGRAQASGRFVDGAWQSFEIHLQEAAISDPGERIQVGRIDGDLRMDAIAAENRLQWQQARVYSIPLGDGSARWNWSPERLWLAQPLSLALLGGSLRIPTLERSRVDGRADWRGAIELERLDVLNLTTALDWPHFSGELSGRLPGFHFREGGFTAEGDIEFKVFDGQMRVSGFNSERTFGVAPSLGADISFDNLDLKQLSSVLDFGEIAGWLDGEVKGLRMLDWAPVAFDARLRTDADYPGKRRISQRAVQGLSSVGGGGSAMNSPMMRLVDSFGYNEIGLNCRLVDNVCEMGGLDREGTGYTILRGAGLPRLTVVGHQRKVDWPVLLSRLQAVSSGQAPVID